MNHAAYTKVIIPAPTDHALNDVMVIAEHHILALGYILARLVVAQGLQANCHGEYLSHIPSWLAPHNDKIFIVTVIHGSRNLAAKEVKPWDVV